LEEVGWVLFESTNRALRMSSALKKGSERRDEKEGKIGELTRRGEG
jgi:hypothetical protein